MSPAPQNILVVRGGALGDFILTLPVLAALRRRFPKSRLEILGDPARAALAVAAGLADDAAPLESSRFAGLFASVGTWAADVSVWLSGFDCIISYLYDPQQIFQTNVTRCSAASFIAGPHRPDETGSLHAAAQLLAPLQALGIHKADPRPRLRLLPGSKVPARLALHPGSGSEKKNWPESKWAELLRIIAEHSDCGVLLIGGEAEGDRGARLAAMLPPGRAQVAQNVPLLALAFKMQDSSAFIGHDSGITHLAAALDLPGIVLWGESNQAVWHPQSSRLIILRDPVGLKALPAETVWRELKNHFPSK